MPRDVIADEKKIETKPDLRHMSVEGLKYLLRHPEEWTKHTWAFKDRLEPTDADFDTGTACGTLGCAIGIADIQWGKDKIGFPLWRDHTGHHLFVVVPRLSTHQIRRLVKLFGGNDNFERIFTHGMNDVERCDRITPEVVVARIEDWQEGRPIRYLRAGDIDPAGNYICPPV